MKTKKKAIGLVVIAVLLVTATIFGTMAYLTSTDSVNNTFTVGKVDIKLDEATVGADGKATDGGRVKENEYKLMPGHEYDKDPTVHFQPGSEAAWLFVEVNNEISGIEAADNNIATQIVANGWKALDGVDGVYYKQAPANTGDNAVVVDYPVFQGFTVSGNVDNVTLEKYEGKTITVTAYAVQADGFATADDAWTTGLGK